MNTANFTIKIGPWKIAISSRYHKVRDLCTNYLSEGTPHFSVNTTLDDLQFEAEVDSRQEAADGHCPKNRSNAYWEALAIQRKITEALFAYNTLLFHGSAIAVDGEAYLFIAKSGTGKSTHSSLWRQLFGDRAVMINDDKPFLEITQDGVTVHGSPWNGVHKLGNSISVPLKAICILERGKVNKIAQISPKESLFMLLQQSSHPQNSALMPKYLELIEILCQKACFYRLQCNTDLEAAEIAFEAMRR